MLPSDVIPANLLFLIVIVLKLLIVSLMGQCTSVSYKCYCAINALAFFSMSIPYFVPYFIRTFLTKSGSIAL